MRRELLQHSCHGRAAIKAHAFDSLGRRGEAQAERERHSADLFPGGVARTVLRRGRDGGTAGAKPWHTTRMTRV
eukprot:scaffold151842_cov30-Tisochrysis_lutea.AAC.1